MKIIRATISEANATGSECLVDLLLAESAEPEASEYLRLRVAVKTEKYPPLATLEEAALQRAQAVMKSLCQEIQRARSSPA